MTEPNLNEQLQERFRQLPKAVQNAITSADVEKRLRSLADTHKLHVDQWQLLENNVMLTLLGFQPMDELADNIKGDIGISEEQAQEMASAISKTVFEPIRQELERELEHPQAKAQEVSGVDSLRTNTLAEEERAGAPVQPSTATTPVAPTIPSAPPASSTQAATPPAPAPTQKAIRMPASGAYKPGEASTTRKDVHDDPYREPPA